MARAGKLIVPFHPATLGFGDYQDLGLQAKNGRFRAAVLVLAWLAP